MLVQNDMNAASTSFSRGPNGLSRAKVGWAGVRPEAVGSKKHRSQKPKRTSSTRAVAKLAVPDGRLKPNSIA